MFLFKVKYYALSLIERFYWNIDNLVTNTMIIVNQRHLRGEKFNYVWASRTLLKTQHHFRDKYTKYNKAVYDLIIAEAENRRI